MNDLEILHDSWEAPGPPADTARTAARAALMERAKAAHTEPLRTEPAHGRPAKKRTARRPRLRTRFAVVGLAAAAITAGAVVIAPFDDESGGRAPGSSPVDALQLLGRAAAAAEHREFTPPRPDQWIYTHYRNVKEPQRWPMHDENDPGEIRYYEEQWTRADGGASAFLEDGKLEVENGTEVPKAAWPPQDYAGLAELPTDPGKLLALAYEHGRSEGAKGSRAGTGVVEERYVESTEVGGEPKPTPPPPSGCTADPKTERDNAAFDNLAAVLGTQLPPPKLEAAVYRAMSRVPGAAAMRTLKLDGGRPGIALGRRQHGWQLYEVLFDARTYRYAGERTTAYRDPREILERCRVLSNSGGNMRVVSVGVVDKAGQRP
ncbi:hypothetical protein [Actinomadura hibisca]|uniref:hypothetical protein n=1 Tax=Actinomadura hibisca TaxID=68565 RepID=UPI000833DBE5|nr:hypothetical protein [Actinomadura hibisca]